MKKLINKAFFVASLGLLAGLGTTGCTVNGNLVGADTNGYAGHLPQWGSTLAPDLHGPFGAVPFVPGHTPENMVVEVNFLDPVGYNESGHTQYYIGQEMRFEVRLYNYGAPSFPNLKIFVEQQYYNDGDCGNTWWGPGIPGYDPAVAVDVRAKGNALGGDSGAIWNSVTLPAQHMIVLQGSYTIPYSVCPGLSQTALKILDESGNLLYYNPETGIWDPPFQS